MREIAAKLPKHSEKADDHLEYTAKFLARASILGSRRLYEDKALRSRLTTADQRSAFDKVDEHAFNELLISVEGEAFRLVNIVGYEGGDNKSSRAWANLTQHYQAANSAKTFEHQKEWSIITCAPEPDPNLFATKLGYLRQQLRANGSESSSQTTTTRWPLLRDYQNHCAHSRSSCCQ